MQRIALLFVTLFFVVNSWAASSVRYTQKTNLLTPAVNDKVTTVNQNPRSFDSTTKLIENNLLLVEKNGQMNLDIGALSHRSRPGDKATVTSIVVGKTAKVDATNPLIFAEILCYANCTSVLPTFEVRCLANVDGADIPCGTAFPDADYSLLASQYKLGVKKASSCNHTDATGSYGFTSGGNPTFGRTDIALSGGRGTYCAAAYPDFLAKYYASGGNQRIVEVADPSIAYDTVLVTY